MSDGPQSAENQMGADVLPDSRWLLTCYTVELVALALWIGGLVVIVTAIIPAVFNTFGMEAGSRFLARVFTGYNRMIAVAILMLLGAGGWRAWLAARAGLSQAAPKRAELVLTAIMVAIAAVITLVLGPASIKLQEEVFAAPTPVARKAAYEAFFQSHHIVRGLYLINLALAIALTAAKLQSWLGWKRPGSSVR